MNKKTSNQKTDFLLGVGLDILRRESMEWLDTIYFWKDKTKFFADLLQKKRGQGTGIWQNAQLSGQDP